jgi:aspartokinase-like uncharacterized kinase
MRVVKLGGSLLDFEGLVPALRRWLAAQPPMANLLVVGGGKLADGIREADRLHKLEVETAHDLAMGAMALAARLVEALLPEAALLPVSEDAELMLPSADRGLAILEPESFLRGLERYLDVRLPHDWSLTSDSISAEAAKEFGAEELVLLKSRVPSLPATLASVSQEGYVDAMFASCARRAGLRIRCVDLRSAD